MAAGLTDGRDDLVERPGHHDDEGTTRPERHRLGNLSAPMETPAHDADRPGVDTAQERTGDVALSTSFGFGGTNASILFKRAA